MKAFINLTKSGCQQVGVGILRIHEVGTDALEVLQFVEVGLETSCNSRESSNQGLY